MTNTTTESADRFLTFLERLKNDRGAMADLRCALIPAKRHRAWPLIGQIGGIGDVVCETVAGLFANHPVEMTTGNIGATCLILSGEHMSFEVRFRRLLACASREDICENMRHIILAAKAKGVGVNYRQLFVDLRYWGDTVKTSWAREFWNVDELPDSAAKTEVMAK